MTREEAELEFLQQEAFYRHKLHETWATQRPLSQDHELVGLMGEVEFSALFRQPVNYLRLGARRYGPDFTVPLRFTVDVKTYRVPKNLPVEKGNVKSDIYVLAEYSDDRKRADLLGWQWGRVLGKAPARDLGYGIVSHCLERGELRPISELRARTLLLR